MRHLRPLRPLLLRAQLPVTGHPSDPLQEQEPASGSRLLVPASPAPLGLP